jgi:hypothetical protein
VGPREKKIRNRDPKREKNLKFWVKGTVPLKFWSKLTAGACNTRSCAASGYRDTCRRLRNFTRAWDTRAWVAVTGYARVRYTRLGKKKLFSSSPGILKRVAMTHGSTRTFLSLHGTKINDFNMVLIDRQQERIFP